MIDLLKEYSNDEFKLKPQTYFRTGLEVRSYFNFGEYCDPRHQLPLSIVIWRLPPTEILKQSDHQGIDIITYVIKGIYRQDNAIQENQLLKDGDIIQYSSGWHRDSNSNDDITEIVQLFFHKGQQEVKQQLYNIDQIITLDNVYEVQVKKNSEFVIDKQIKYFIVLNLSEQVLKLNDKILKQYELIYFSNLKEKIEINGTHYIVIKLF